MIGRLIQFMSIWVFMPTLAFAAHAKEATGLGTLADEFIGPVNTIISFVSVSSFVIGGTCLFSAFLRAL